MGRECSIYLTWRRADFCWGLSDCSTQQLICDTGLFGGWDLNAWHVFLATLTILSVFLFDSPFCALPSLDTSKSRLLCQAWERQEKRRRKKSHTLEPSARAPSNDGYQKSFRDSLLFTHIEKARMDSLNRLRISKTTEVHLLYEAARTRWREKCWKNFVCRFRFFFPFRPLFNSISSLFVFPPCNRSRGLNCAPFASDYCATWPEIGGQEEGPRRRVRKTLTQVLFISAERERKKLISRGKNMHTHTPHRRENCASNKQRTEKLFPKHVELIFWQLSSLLHKIIRPECASLALSSRRQRRIIESGLCFSFSSIGNGMTSVESVLSRMRFSLLVSFFIS